MIVGLFINNANRRFSITARHANDSKLSAMERAEWELGFSFVILAEGLDKQRADAFKAIQIAAYENAGYTRVPRTIV